MNDMDEVMNEIDVAYKAISSIPVTGDAVDAMAVARARLRNAYAKIKQMTYGEENVHGDGAGTSSHGS